MIVNVLLNFVVNVFCALFKGLEIVSLPTDMIASLLSIISYGNYVIGADLTMAIFGSIMGWITIRSTVGLVIFIWKLLPLT